MRTLQLHRDGHEGYDGFAGEMPHGITFGHDAAAVRALLGEPTTSGQPTPVSGPRAMPRWDRYVLGDLVLHVEYTLEGDGIRLVSLMTVAAAP